MNRIDRVVVQVVATSLLLLLTLSCMRGTEVKGEDPDQDYEQVEGVRYTFGLRAHPNGEASINTDVDDQEDMVYKLRRFVGTPTGQQFNDNPGEEYPDLFTSGERIGNELSPIVLTDGQPGFKKYILPRLRQNFKILFIANERSIGDAIKSLDKSFYNDFYPFSGEQSKKAFGTEPYFDLANNKEHNKRRFLMAAHLKLEEDQPEPVNGVLHEEKVLLKRQFAKFTVNIRWKGVGNPLTITDDANTVKIDTIKTINIPSQFGLADPIEDVDKTDPINPDSTYLKKLLSVQQGFAYLEHRWAGMAGDPFQELMEDANESKPLTNNDTTNPVTERDPLTFDFYLPPYYPQNISADAQTSLDLVIKDNLSDEAAIRRKWRFPLGTPTKADDGIRYFIVPNTHYTINITITGWKVESEIVIVSQGWTHEDMGVVEL